MSNFYFYNEDDAGVKSETTFQAVSLDEILENFDRFLKAAGFVPSGDLEYTSYESSSEEEVLQEKLNSVETRIEHLLATVRCNILTEFPVNKEYLKKELKKIVRNIRA